MTKPVSHACVCSHPFFCRTATATVASLGLTVFEVATRTELPGDGEDWHAMRDGRSVGLPSSRSKDLGAVLRQVKIRFFGGGEEGYFSYVSAPLWSALLLARFTYVGLRHFFFSTLVCDIKGAVAAQSPFHLSFSYRFLYLHFFLSVKRLIIILRARTIRHIIKTDETID